ncbi:sugar ABC transporter ATP-binding protein [Pseudogemmobacter bohemicus]|uniref:sugar ABC transporter ATP-binding protein n=1 Tax=Pseudogemmobacter bohemicus TaxID=2250708 RepID=UPI000DD4CB36|nr:sugar ABC transporter ATP-binding protein [Pseudogemmobacter bohemicus]
MTKAPDPRLPASQPAVELRGIVKTYGASQALRGADLVLHPGQIHGLVGQNGAGKSTIIRILAGIEQADPGSGLVQVFGEAVSHPSPEEMERRGIHFIHQDRLLVPTATVAEAIALGQEPKFGPFYNGRRATRQAEALIRRHFGLDIPGNRLIRDLSAAEQKIVQISRALASDARVLVLDEPTAALVRREVESLFSVLRNLRSRGLSILFISHYMDEIEEICDHVTVFHDGRHVASHPVASTSIPEIVTEMVNREVGELYPRRSHAPGAVVLKVEGLGRDGAFSDVGFELRAGEVLGISGLLGSGAKEILATLFGLAPADHGRVTLEGRPYAPGSVRAAVSRGVVLVPEDRRRQGVSVSHSIRENITLGNLGLLSRLGLVSRSSERSLAGRGIADLSIRTTGPDQKVAALSGGNQQKVVLSKWLSSGARVYLLDEPTVAVDVGAKVEIYTVLNRLASEGAAVIVLSSDLLELAGLCDRALIIHRGRIAGRFEGETLRPELMLAAASGATPHLPGPNMKGAA